ncbi:TPA: hypothetical protein DCW38_08460 [candidate division WOR-3 bacterium]|jgi:hypothetical protein|uniref:Uncharacterized protein n=1 Tax=candidate division WOR-3 bacterium TaxID=2052148 RepID=A0A350HCC5_UNCW3|nr:hypothetical protein [candidate division WOR-3 bacterium]
MSVGSFEKTLEMIIDLVYIFFMSYRKIGCAVILILAVNFSISFFYLKDVFRLTKYASQFTGERKILEVERYSGYDNVVQFVKYGDVLKGNTVIVNTTSDYSTRFTEFYNLSYLSSHKVFYAPIQIALNKDFTDSRNITKMVVLWEEGVVVHAEDSLFETSAYPFSCEVMKNIVRFQWFYPHGNDLNLYVSDEEGRVVFKTGVPFETAKDSFYEVRIPLEKLNLKKGVYFWNVSKPSFAKFMLFPGRFSYD